MGLGKSFCQKCFIRYSQSERNLKCCKMEKSGQYMCKNDLTHILNYECDKGHSVVEINFVMETNEKRPYKK
jgi:hypothetical protein